MLHRPDCHHPLRRAAAAVTVSLALGAASLPALAQPSPAGTFANGSARELEFICAGCSNPSRIAWSEQGGGWGLARAEVSALAPGSYSGSARATLSAAANALPVLSASATVDVLIEPGPVVPKVFLYTAGATAQGYQPYRYLGNTPTTYSIDYAIEGLITGGSPDAALNSNAIRGGVNVVLGLHDPLQEGGATVLAQSQRGAKGNGQQVDVALSDTVQFEVLPFDIFTVYAYLSASASSMVDGTPGAALAGNTMHVVFSGGDTGLLEVLAASPVPEPAQALLLGLGLGLGSLVCAARARRPRAQQRDAHQRASPPLRHPAGLAGTFAAQADQRATAVA